MMRKRASNNNYRFLTPDLSDSTHYSDFELSESDVWTGSTQCDSFESRPPPTSPISRRQSTARRTRSTGEPKSVPVNVPDWSKILREECRDRERKSNGVYFNGDEDDDVAVVPPHEYLAKTRRESMSVQEGIGRKLKGRDLSQLRNAIWEITGFQD